MSKLTKSLVAIRATRGHGDMGCNHLQSHLQSSAAIILPRQCCNCVSTSLTNSRSLRACVRLRVLDVLLLRDVKNWIERRPSVPDPRGSPPPEEARKELCFGRCKAFLRFLRAAKGSGII